MQKKYKIITLCGSAKFYDTFLKVQQQLTLQGNIVLSINHFDNNVSNNFTPETRAMLDEMHKIKIDMSDEIFVINKNGYIGQSTQNEINYATKTGKKVNYLE